MLFRSKNAAKRFWVYLLGILSNLGYKYNRVDPCVYFKWDSDGLHLWGSWVDDMLGVGNSIIKEKEKFMEQVECDDTGEIQEYVGCKVQFDDVNCTIKLTQPVLIQSFNDEFTLVGVVAGLVKVANGQTDRQTGANFGGSEATEGPLGVQ